MVLKNLDATNAVSLGDNNVVAGAGYKLVAGESITFWLNPGQYVWAVAEAGNPILSVLENLR